MAKNGNTITWRIGQLEKQVEELDDKVEKLMTNHIPHLHEELSSLKTRVSLATALNIGAVIVGVLIAKYL